MCDSHIVIITDGICWHNVCKNENCNRCKMRTPQIQGIKGSLKWIQVLINRNPEIIKHQLGIDSIEWCSPLVDDEHSEYSDGDFLRILGLDHLQDQLKDFWPRNGPQWDALGKAGNKIFLVEAKANIPKIGSSCAAKSPKSIAMIEKAINDTKSILTVADGKGWLNGFYQYANRLAHLYFLREICGVDAKLVFVYFCGDSTHIPTSIDEWELALANQKRSMGLSKLDNVSELFISCTELE